MKTRKELKQEAKDALRGNWGWAIAVNVLPYVIITSILYVIVLVIGIIAVAMAEPYTGEPSPIIIFVILPYIVSLFAFIGVYYSLDSAFLDLVRGKKPEITAATTYAFRKKRYWKFFVTGWVRDIFISLWFLLFYIPGIIKSFSYAMTSYVLKDDLEQGNLTTATSSITKSRALMDGHKWDLFVLGLSFLGWFVLAILSLGIGFFWLIPYMRTTYAAFYNNLVKNTNESDSDDKNDDINTPVKNDSEVEKTTLQFDTPFE